MPSFQLLWGFSIAVKYQLVVLNHGYSTSLSLCLDRKNDRQLKYHTGECYRARFHRHCRRSVLRRIRLPPRIMSMSWLQYTDNEANFRLGTHTNIMLGQRRRPRINIKLALIWPSQRWNIFVKTMKSKMFSQFEIIIQVLVSSFRFIWIPMSWVNGHYQFFQCGDQNLTSIDVRFWRLKSIPVLKGFMSRCFW